MLIFSLFSTAALTLLFGSVSAKNPTTSTVSATPTVITPGTNTTSTSPVPKPTYESCGGYRVKPKECPYGQICIDDPYAHGCGMACDAPGICVKPTFCGGIAGFQCTDGNGKPDGRKCIDDPRDDCDPKHGGADCGGICV